MKTLSSLKISISGVRGIVGLSLTPQLIASFSAAFGSYAGRGPILVGSDTRPSRHMVTQAVFAGLLGTGARVIDLGVVPVPSVQLLVKKKRAFGGIAVTASHNPIEWNAMKFIGPDGLFLNQYRAEELLDIYHQGEFRRVPDREIQQVKRDGSAFEHHLEAILKYVDRDAIAGRKFRVALDCVNGAASEAAPRLLEALGCEYVAINTNMDQPFPHSPEPIPENLGELSALAAKEDVDIAFAQDADADRLAVVCPRLGPIGEEYSLVLAIKQVLKTRKAPVVVNLSTSMLVEDLACEAGVPVYRTKVGEINVTEKLLAEKGAIGGEGNGGVIIPQIHPCRDSFAGMAVILQLLAEEARPLHEIIASLPRYSIVKEKIACPSAAVYPVLKRIEELLGEGVEVDRSDGIRLAWPKRWLQVRASNTEPIVRVIAEAETDEEARSLVQTAMEEVRRIGGQ
ncbi:MAG: phosphoglucosamine mutase [Planctomycetota bacterium]